MKNDVSRMGRGWRKLALLLAALAVFLVLAYKLQFCIVQDKEAVMVAKKNYVVGSDQQVYSYNRYMPLIFIGGVPRSGTTLLLAMLDAHPDVRCGQETRVIPRILQMRQHWMKSKKERSRLEEAGIQNMVLTMTVDDEKRLRAFEREILRKIYGPVREGETWSVQVLDEAIAAFCLEVIARQGELAPRLCNKDPLTLKSADYLSKLFPQSKFIFMVRDGRATVHSIISRQVTITGFNLTNHRKCMRRWNNAITTMYERCKLVGSDRCMLVYYEQLVLHPAYIMRRILNFLDVPWNESVLHHEEHINMSGGIFFSKMSRSSDQVIRPVNAVALTKWVGKLPKDLVRDMAVLAPMLAKLGYDPYANPPHYGLADVSVADNTRRIRDQVWKKLASNMVSSSKGPVDAVMETTAATA